VHCMPWLLDPLFFLQGCFRSRRDAVSSVITSFVLLVGASVADNVVPAGSCVFASRLVRRSLSALALPLVSRVDWRCLLPFRPARGSEAEAPLGRAWSPIWFHFFLNLTRTIAREQKRNVFLLLFLPDTLLLPCTCLKLLLVESAGRSAAGCRACTGAAALLGGRRHREPRVPRPLLLHRTRRCHHKQSRCTRLVPIDSFTRGSVVRERACTQVPGKPFTT
jgi:hypothetical protein